MTFIKKLPIQRRPSPTLCAILPLHDYVTLNTVVAALHIPQYLKIICLCINDVVGSYTNWWRLHGNGPISWSLKNLFTSPTLISLLNILYPSDTPIMQNLQYFNHTLLHKFIPHTLLTISLSKPMTHLLYIGSKISHQFYQLS